jgi:hypothetical protein
MLEDQNWSHFRSSKKCKIHDLMHDIALSVLGEECAAITDRYDQKKLLSKHTQHMLLSCYDQKKLHGILDYIALSPLGGIYRVQRLGGKAPPRYIWQSGITYPNLPNIL